MGLLLEFIFAWLLADFIVGFVHFYEDKCLNEKSANKIVQSILADNDLHHTKPMAMTKLSAWKNLNTSLYIGIPIVLLSLFMDIPIISMAMFIACFGNLFHKWSHTHSKKTNIVIKAMMFIGMLQTREQHNRHHFDENGIIIRKNAKTDFCVMTPYLNPILDKLKFWKLMEKLLK